MSHQNYIHHTYTTCSDDHKTIFNYSDKSRIVKLRSPREYWDIFTHSIKTIDILGLDKPALLYDKTSVYLFIPHHKPLPIIPFRID